MNDNDNDNDNDDKGEVKIISHQPGGEIYLAT